MTQKERKKEEQELAKAVSVLRATLYSIAHRKARQYEQEFLHRVRDIIDQELSDYAEANKYSADYVGCSVKTEIMKKD